MKPVMVKTEGGGSAEIRVNAGGGIFIRHSQMNPETWAELREYQQKESSVFELPKRGGFIIVNHRVFSLSSREVNTIHEAVSQNEGMVPRLSNEEIATQSEMQQSIAKIDTEATNQLLESYLHLQNQLDAWTKVLEQTAEFHDAVLTPAQKEATRLAIKHSKCLSDNLQRLQGGVLK
jgi:hypothetical protein